MVAGAKVLAIMVVVIPILILETQVIMDHSLLFQEATFHMVVVQVQMDFLVQALTTAAGLVQMDTTQMQGILATITK
ncbi:hypothetical protein C7425_104274 [Pantoea ananatis]|nr:hypothetical protein C7425_104274 [Pantoea ananatis]